MENILKKWWKKITWFKSDIRINNDKTFTIIYKIDIKEESDKMKQDYYVELKNHVWNETKKAKIQVNKMNDVDILDF